MRLDVEESRSNSRAEFRDCMRRPSLDVPTKSHRTISSDLCVRCAVANMGCRLEELAGVRTQWLLKFLIGLSQVSDGLIGMVRILHLSKAL